CTPPAGQRLAAAPPAAQVAQLYWLAVRRARSLDQACPAPRSGADGPPALRRNRELVLAAGGSRGGQPPQGGPPRSRVAGRLQGSLGEQPHHVRPWCPSPYRRRA